MAWLEKGVTLTPTLYRIELTDYKHLPESTEEQIRQTSKEWLETLCNMWGEKERWFLSGSFALSLITNTFPRPNTNTDIAISLENCPELLSWMQERAKAHALFLFSRAPHTFYPDSFRPAHHKGEWFPETKLENYFLVDAEKITKNTKKNQNYMFCQVDQNGMIIPSNRIDTRIRIYPYKYEDEYDAYRSIEDGRLINPHYLKLPHKNRHPLIQQENKRVLPASLYHIKELKELIDSKHPKHGQDLARINKFLAENPDYRLSKE